MTKIWDDLLSLQDKDVIISAGYDKLGAATWESRELGSNPALLVIDMQNHLVGKDEPILAAIKKERTAMGEIAWQAIKPIASLISTCRIAQVPIIYTKVVPRGRAPEEESIQIVDAVKPRAEDLVLEKNFSSAFFGTDLLSHLSKQKIDTVIIVGNSTSGCVRASAVDARQMGFSVLIPQECTFDRIEASHKISLLDLWMKYAIVSSVDEVSKYVIRLNQTELLKMENRQ